MTEGATIQASGICNTWARCFREGLIPAKVVTVTTKRGQMGPPFAQILIKGVGVFEHVFGII